jgi:uncharacterized protein YjlB
MPCLYQTFWCLGGSGIKQPFFIMHMQKPTSLQFDVNEQIPNNPRLPLLLYKQVFEDKEKLEQQFRETFQANQWGGSWVNGVFNYHHYHSTAHEVLGIAAGTATLVFGGPKGKELAVQAGDMVVIPAGVGHCRKTASPDFSVVGAYPKGQENYDLCTEKDDVEKKKKNIDQVPLPQADPVDGSAGWLTKIWNGTKA